MIIATARAAKCSVLYSEDDDMLRHGEGHIEVSRLPQLPETQVLLPDIEIKPKKKKK